ncbi:MAG: hypothetical protein M1823_001970 [Watsoniomyces obsoletus]|nr:MAG: hypothetical protein M1823_001970 [Watsoniomyces obsoletus]
MAYPPPPGLESTRRMAGSPNNLPARPPLPSVSPSSFTPAFSAPPYTSSLPGTSSYGGGPPGVTAPMQASPSTFGPFKPRQVASTASNWRGPPLTVSAPSASSAAYAAPAGYGGGAFAPQSQYQSGQPGYYQNPGHDPYSAISAPQIRNPFPLPGQEPYGGPGRGRGGGAPGRYPDAEADAELEAQIAQWQSAYAGKDGAEAASAKTAGGGGRPNNRCAVPGAEGAASASGANAGPLGGRLDGVASTGGASASITTAETPAGASGTTATNGTADGKEKTVVRSGGGQTWTDSTLLEWDPAHFRLFVGNLAGEVTDESLLKAFARYPSVQKGRVVRDKRTTKSKGYGFVSFSDGDEYFQAAKEMQGKYIGSHPVLLRRSTTEIRPVAPQDKKGKHGKKGASHAGGAGGGGGARTGAGVHKKSGKTKGGLRVLG